MKVLNQIRVCFWSIALIFIMAACAALGAQTTSGPGAAYTAINAVGERDGQHDFDFLFGSWKVHLKRRLHPLTGSNNWVEYDGMGVYQKVWDGRANINEFEAESPSGHVLGLTLRTYNPQNHQWSLYWANSDDGVLSSPPQVGEFKDGQGEFYAQDTLNGKLIFIRYLWTKVSANAVHFEQAYSDDGAKTWEVNWISDMTRITDDTSQAPAAMPSNSNSGTTTSVTPTSGTSAATEPEGQRDFDFELGSWNIHLKRRRNPLTGSNTWVEFDGTSRTRKLWGGRAQIEEFETDGAAGHIEGLTLRTYNPQSHQWSLYWANSKDGKVVLPQMGQFKNGQGEFYAQDTLDSLNGKSIFVRFIWSNTNSNKPHFEQAFSADGGRSWEVNWITDQTHAESGPAH